MPLSTHKKAKLKKLLDTISTSDEKDTLAKIDANKIQSIITTFEQQAAEDTDRYETLLTAVNQYAAKSASHTKFLTEQFSQALESMNKAIGGHMEKMAGKITTSYEKNKPYNAAGVYKDMINQLSAVKESIDKKPVPVWNWPQYAAVSVRNSSFKLVNPAVDGFNIGSYDDIQMTYSGSNLTVVNYYLSGAQTAQLTLSYNGSNLTEVKRTL